MENQRTHHRTNNIHRQHDDWDEVHNQLIAIQKKSLEVSDPNDADEKEADEVARKVVNGEEATINGSSSGINRKGREKIQRQTGDGSASNAGKGLGKIGQSTPSSLELTAYELNSYIATVMAESSQGAVQPNEIAWIYYNIINDGVAAGNSVETALHASVAASGAYNKKTKTYAGPNGWWKGYMTGLGETKFAAEKIPSYMVSPGLPSGSTYADYVKTEFYVNKAAPRVESVKNYIVNTILKKPALNPYPGWHNQGYYGDFNRDDKLWKTARAYFWLQKDGTVTEIYVKELYDKKDPTFIFNSTKILAYFDKNPDKLPAVVPYYDPVTRGKKK